MIYAGVVDTESANARFNHLLTQSGSDGSIECNGTTMSTTPPTFPSDRSVPAALRWRQPPRRGHAPRALLSSRHEVADPFDLVEVARHCVLCDPRRVRLLHRRMM